MKKLTLTLILFCTFLQAFADIVKSEPTGYPMLDSALIVGVVAVAVLLIVRRVRRRRSM